MSLVLLTVVLGLSVGKTEKDISAVLGMVSLCIAACAAVTVLEPVLDYLVELRRVFNLPDELVSTLLKAVGIALTAELSAAVCTDAGSASLGKILQILGGAVVLSLSIPMFRTLMTIIKEMTGGI
ncbi:MAG: stage III sporulation AC/AD family protein [Clostridiales bacterium]|nr:stage III sporulation AC/AD family protein [Clostridiales bacterium]